MIDIISQVWITIFGLLGLWYMQGERRRLGVVFGLIGQPAWYAQLVINEQWGMLPVFVGYTACWVRGFWLLFVQPIIIEAGQALTAFDGEAGR